MREKLLVAMGLLPTVYDNFGRVFLMVLPRSGTNEYTTEIWGRVRSVEILQLDDVVAEEEDCVDNYELHVHVDQRCVMKDELLCLVCHLGYEDPPKVHWAAHLRLPDKTDESGWMLADIEGEFKLL
jgi:hypothetical protein